MRWPSRCRRPRQRTSPPGRTSRDNALVKFLRPLADCRQARSRWNRTRTISLLESPPAKGLRISVRKPTQRSCARGDVLILLVIVTYRFLSFKVFAHETPAFVRKQPHYGAAGTNHVK